jgi:hypothetical protein
VSSLSASAGTDRTAIQSLARTAEILRLLARRRRRRSRHAARIQQGEGVNPRRQRRRRLLVARLSAGVLESVLGIARAAVRGRRRRAKPRTPRGLFTTPSRPTYGHATPVRSQPICTNGSRRARSRNTDSIEPSPRNTLANECRAQRIDEAPSTQKQKAPGLGEPELWRLRRVVRRRCDGGLGVGGRGGSDPAVDNRCYAKLATLRALAGCPIAPGLDRWSRLRHDSSVLAALKLPASVGANLSGAGRALVPDGMSRVNREAHLPSRSRAVAAHCAGKATLSEGGGLEHPDSGP